MLWAFGDCLSGRPRVHYDELHLVGCNFCFRKLLLFGHNLGISQGPEWSRSYGWSHQDNIAALWVPPTERVQGNTGRLGRILVSAAGYVCLEDVLSVVATATAMALKRSVKKMKSFSCHDQAIKASRGWCSNESTWNVIKNRGLLLQTRYFYQKDQGGVQGELTFLRSGAARGHACCPWCESSYRSLGGTEKVVHLHGFWRGSSDSAVH